MPIYALKVQTGKEDQVIKLITEHLDIIPDVSKVFHPNNSQQLPLFPGYIFVEPKGNELSATTYYKILELDFTHYFLCPKSGVNPLVPTEENALQDREPITAGAAVAIKSGKFKGLTGTLQNVTSKIAVVETMVFGQLIELEVSLNSIKLLDTAEF